MNDSTQETLAHIRRVQTLLQEVIEQLGQRAIVHDQSKLEKPEKEMFDSVTGVLKGLTYGSPEYKAQLAKLGPALDHHYRSNTHHPEYFAQFYVCPECSNRTQWEFVSVDLVCGPCGSPMKREPRIEGMSLLDVIEMLADWKAAGERHVDGSMAKSLTHNKDRFQISDQLQSILHNTAKELGWLS